MVCLMGISQMRPCFSLFDTEKIDSKVSRSTVDLHFPDFVNFRPESKESLPVGINLLHIIGTEKIDLKVSRSTIDLHFPKMPFDIKDMFISEILTLAGVKGLYRT